ncbi:MAG: sugar ABC transporter substrate-binding protein [Actinomycetaceae bacterium]|nr:sugar ABC transporter substrate-binding protein [Actinomycetaceae bacterium]
MVTRKRATLAIASVAALALSLGACGSTGDNKASSGSGVELQMVESLTNPDRTKLIRSLLDEFEAANPDIKVKLVSPPTEQADNKIQQMLQSGSGVDVLEVRDLTVGPFSNNGWLYDMSADLESWEGFKNLTPNAQLVSKASDGKSYFIPYGFYGLSLFYRVDLIEKAGFDKAPHSWQDLLEQSKKIQNPDENTYGYAFRGAKNSIGQMAACIEAFVGDNLDIQNSYFTKDGATIFSTPEAKQAVELYLELFKNGSPPSSVNWGYPEMVDGFKTGMTAFLLQDPEVIATIRSDSNLVEGTQWTTTPLLVGPTGKAAQPIATAGWGVAQNSKHHEQAVKLVQFLSGDASTTFAKENNLIPILTTASEDEYYKTGPWAAYVSMSEDTSTYMAVTEPRSSKHWSEWMDKTYTEIQAVLVGSMTSDDMLASWDTFWKDKK